MDIDQQVLVYLLSLAIRGKRPQDFVIGEADWKSIFEQAVSHDVYALMYPAVKDLSPEYGPDRDLMLKWERAVLFAGMTQIQHMEKLGEVFRCFNDAGIPVVALKGIVLRELYPQPELRTMADVDILVRDEHKKRAKNLLLCMGYVEDDSDFKHTVLRYADLVIELHNMLMSHESLKAAECFEKSIWSSTAPAQINGMPVLLLSSDDSLLYMFLHLAEHIASYGFGLRQLCDIVIFIESYKDKLDWDYLYSHIKAFGIERFVFAVFVTCHKLFGMELPNGLFCREVADHPYLEVFINDILSGGVHGHTDFSRHIGNSLLRYVNYDGSENSSGKIKYYISFLFPTADRLRKRYSYARRSPFLIPAAWLHRLLYNICRKNFVSIVRTAFLHPRRSLATFEERTGLLRWLNLK
ncbi:MAG: nucleotidyltransferase family protein [Clostridia bacterium]|nr:nucleotidyltransferase family protein [Clostridia bacterium]